jgi:hypothetical protein
MNIFTKLRRRRRAIRFARLRELYDIDRWLNDIRKSEDRKR